MELRQLEYFAAVARHGTFRRAAEESYVTQSALSQGVSRLERELGVALFDRAAGGGVSLTPAGEALLAHADRTLAAAAEARAEMDAFAGLRRGVARIAVTVGDAPWIAEDLVDFHRAHPGLQVALRHGSAGEVRALARQGDVDVAVSGVSTDEERDVTLLSDAPLVVITAADHPLAARGELTITDLREEAFVLGERASALREAVAAACMEAGFSPLPRFEVADPATVRTLVAAGMGVALVPAPWLRAGDGGADVAIARLADAPRHRVGLLAGANASPAGRLLADHIAAAERDN